MKGASKLCAATRPWVPRIIGFLFASCAPLATAEPVVLPCNDLAQVKTRITKDEKTTQDGNGSIKVEAACNAVVTVVDNRNLSVTQGNTLWCTLRVKCAGVKQKAYLEMWCEVADGKRAFSKGLDQPLQGDTDWKEIRLPMLVNDDLTVKRALVNVVIEGAGTVWVDEVSISKAHGLSARFQQQP